MRVAEWMIHLLLKDATSLTSNMTEALQTGMAVGQKTMAARRMITQSSAMRIYWPKAEVLDGRWKQPAIQIAD